MVLSGHEVALDTTASSSSRYFINWHLKQSVLFRVTLLSFMHVIC